MFEHSQLVRRLSKPGKEIIDELTPEKAHLWHMTSCVMGEAGELFDAIKKHVIYNKPLDEENVVEELGDIEFYLEGLRQSFNLPRNRTLNSNITKLTERYGETYSDKAAQERKDKQIGHETIHDIADQVGE